jgi:hypothetical protein
MKIELARLSHFLPFAHLLLLIPILMLINIHPTNGSHSLHHHHQPLRRRSVSSFVKDIGDGLKQNVILVKSNNDKGRVIEGFIIKFMGLFFKFNFLIFVERRKRLNQTNPTSSSESSSAQNDFDHLEEEDLGDSDVSEERFEPFQLR